MLAWLKQRRRRKLLSPVVVELPRLLAHQFAGKDYYTAAQVRRALEVLKIAPEAQLTPYAYALACAPAEFMQVLPNLAPVRRREMRIELAELFDINGADLAMHQLRRARLRTAFQTADPADWERYGGPGSHPHAGDGTP